MQAVLAEWGRVDILVNNAGVIRDKLFLQMDADDWNAVIGTNLGGTFAFCKAVAKQMAFKQRSGRIINVSSIAAEHVNVGQANYAASKGAINSLTRVLAVELGRRNVLVNAVAPGFIETDMSQAVRNMAGEDNLKKLIPVRAARQTRGHRRRGGVPGGPGGGLHHRTGDYRGRRPEPRGGVRLSAGWREDHDARRDIREGPHHPRGRAQRRRRRGHADRRGSRAT